MPLFPSKFVNQSDEALMRLWQKGRRSAFRVLYQRYKVKIYRFFYRWLNADEELANDFTQDLFLKIVERPEVFDASRKFSSWIYAVAHNMVKNEYRRISRAPSKVALEGLDFEPSTEIFLNLDFDRETERKALVRAIARLGPNHKTCFVLRYYEGLDIKAIAEIMSCPVGTVKSRLFYSLNQITEQLNAYAE